MNTIPDNSQNNAMGQGLDEVETALVNVEKAVVRSGSRVALVMALLALLLGLALAAGGAFLWLQMQQHYAAGLEQWQQLSRQQGQLGQSLDGFDARLTKAASQQGEANTELQRSIGELAARITDNQQRLQALTSHDRSSWQLAEAEFLLRLANERLFVEQDVTNAKALFKAVDNLLRDIGESGLLPIRQALAADMATLNQVEVVDRPGRYLELEALIRQLPSLVLFRQPEITPDVSATERPQTSSVAREGGPSWQQQIITAWHEALQKLASYLRIQRREQPVSALPDAQDRLLAISNLQLLINQAEMAMLSGEQGVYQQSLEKARQWVSSTFAADDIHTRQLLAQLDKLQKQPVLITLPDVSQSQQLLQRYLEQRHYRIEPPAPVAAGSAQGSAGK